MVFLIILFSVVIIGGIALLYLEKMRSRKEKPTGTNHFKESISDINDLYQIDNIYDGVIYKDDQCYMLARVGGLNFTIMSNDEQNARESALVGIFARLDYPIRFVTNTVIADTSEEARRIADIATQTPDGTLLKYRLEYAGTLELMRTERMVTTQSTFIVIPGQDKEELTNRFNIIAASLRQQGNVLVTQLQYTEEIYDTLQEILMPYKISRPSTIAMHGVGSSIYTTEKEVLAYVQ